MPYPFDELSIRSLNNDEYLHYASLGFIPGVDPSDPFVADRLAVDVMRTGDARRDLVEQRQEHPTALDRMLSLAAL